MFGPLETWIFRIALEAENAVRAEAAIRSLGFNLPWLNPEVFLKKGMVLRIGQEPLRFDIINITVRRCRLTVRGVGVAGWRGETTIISIAHHPTPPHPQRES